MNRDKTQMPEYTNDGVGRLNKLSYRDGYLHTRDSEPDVAQESQHSPQKNDGHKGLILSIKLAVIASLVGVTSFLAMQQYRQITIPVDASPAPVRSQR
jgi:hypothetical protein